MKKMKSLLTMTLMVAMVLTMSSFAFATPNLDVISVEINDHEVAEDCDAGTTCEETIDLYELNDVLDIEIKVGANVDVEDITMFAYLAGYEYADKESVMDSVPTFDLKANRTKWKTMKITIPQKLDTDVYDLRILVSERTGNSNEYRLTIETEGADHQIAIKGVVFSPDQVIAGRSLLSYVRLKNYGETNEETVLVKVAIPELGVSASEFVDELDSTDSISSEELYLRIPKCAESGDYDVEVSVEYDEGYEYYTTTERISVIADESAACGAGSEAKPVTQNIITVGEEMQDVKAGAGAVIYPLTVSNLGTETKSYTVSVEGSDFATFTVTPSNVVLLNPGESKAIYVNVEAKEDAAAGEKMFAISVNSGGKVLKEIPLKANVVVEETSVAASGWSKVKKGLEIGLLVLVVLLVFLGLIIGFNKMKGSDDDDDDEGSQTYY